VLTKLYSVFCIHFVKTILFDANTATGLTVAKSLAIDLTANHTAACHCQYTWAEAATIINTQTVYDHKREPDEVIFF
jgi:hypothetical protein